MDLNRLRELLGRVANWEEIPEEKDCRRSGSPRTIVNLSTVLIQVQDKTVSQDCNGYFRA